MYLILKDVDNKASAGNKIENCNFEFPINLTQTTLSHFFKGKQGTFVTIKKIIDYIENY